MAATSEWCRCAGDAKIALPPDWISYVRRPKMKVPDCSYIGFSRASAQTKTVGALDDALSRQIAAADSAFFDAYNNCQLATIKPYFTSDVGFYHDQSGLSHLPAPMNDLRKYTCGKVHRDPVLATLEVYPLKGYGAVATGLHRFCDSRKYRTCEEGASDVAKLVTLWRKQNGKWRMSRVISYDHASSH